MTFRRFAFVLPLIGSLAACAAPAEEEDTRRSTFAFTPDEITAFRIPTNAPCGVDDTPYEAADSFALRPTDKDANARVSGLALNFPSTAAGTTHLKVNGMNAFGNAMLLQVGVPAGAAEKPLASARVVIDGLPTKDGDALSARIVIEFADGDVLAETISAPVKSAFGACPTGR